jgi:hypothetical protein
MAHASEEKMAKDEKNQLPKALDTGLEVTGTAAAAAGGLLFAGPVGAIGGAAAGPAFTAGLREVISRLLSRREQARVQTAMNYAVSAVIERLDAEELMRSDGFFSTNDSARSAADEIVEGVLITAKRQHEERKVEYLGYLLANLAFEAEIDQPLANWLVRTVDSLSWAQLCLLSAVAQKGSRIDLPAVDIGKSAGSWHSWGIHQQLQDIGYYGKHLIGAVRPSESPRQIPLSEPDLRKQELSDAGRLLVELMWLDRIPGADITATLALLERDPSE